MAVYVNPLRGQSRFLLGRTSAPPPLFALTADAEESCMPSRPSSACAGIPAAWPDRSTLPGTTR